MNINIDDVLFSFDELHGIIPALDPCLLCPVPRLVLPDTGYCFKFLQLLLQLLGQQELIYTNAFLNLAPH